MKGVITGHAAGCIELRAMVSRFHVLVADWALDDRDLDGLLAAGPGDGLALARGCLTPTSDSEARMRRAIELDALLRSALGGCEESREWLRQPNPGIIGRRKPLELICDGSTGLRALRDALRDELRQARVAASR